MGTLGSGSLTQEAVPHMLSMMQRLTAMVNLVLPALWVRDPDGNSDLNVNLRDHRVDIRAHGKVTPLVTLAEIDDGTWRAVIRARLDEAFADEGAK